jgi:xanthine/CO dehydrogenase XdhC/CoxF family maturation factor
MNHWRETGEILDRVAELGSRGRRAAIATVVRISGSSYRRPGAKFLIEDDGRTRGGVSGGCLEADVREIALHVMRTDLAQLLHYDTGSDDNTVWGLGLGCNGSVDVFVQPANRTFLSEVLPAIRARLEKSETFAVSTIVDGPADVGRSIVVDMHRASKTEGGTEIDSGWARLATGALARPQGRSSIDRLDSKLIFTEVLKAPSRLIVCGAGDDAKPLAAYASAAGFDVIVIDHRPAYLSSERFPTARRLLQLRPDEDVKSLIVESGDMAVIKTHSFAHDREWVRVLLATDAAYIGLLGPRPRADEILKQVGGSAVDRLFGPVGLDIGADGPEQIAISIVAELLAVHSRQQPRHLRERGAAIHVA